MPLRFDATLKGLAEGDPPGFLTGLHLPPAGPVSQLNVDLSTITSSTDLVFGIGDPLSEIIHLDFQSGASASKNRDVLVYNALLHRTYAVPVHSAVVLLRTQAAHSNLDGAIHYEARPGQGKMDFVYEVIHLWEMPVEQLLTGNIFLVPMAPLGLLPPNVPPDDALANVIRRVVERLLAESPPGKSKELIAAAYTLTGLRVPTHEAKKLFRGVQVMHDSSTYQAILDEGAARQARKIILRQGTIRFGTPDENTRARLHAIEELEPLDAMTDRLLTASNWQELLGNS